jgi:hypothetical protein
VSVELACERPSEATERRLIRILTDIKALSRLTRPEVRGVYGEIEIARDALSRILDDADGKNA